MIKLGGRVSQENLKYQPIPFPSLRTPAHPDSGSTDSRTSLANKNTSVLKVLADPD